MTFGRVLTLLTIISVAAVGGILLWPEIRWTLPPAASAEAEGIDNLYRLMLIISTIIFIFVQGFLIYFALIFKRKPEDGPDAVGRNLHGDNRLEIAWTIAPAIIAVVLTVLSFRELQALRLNQVVEGARTVDVVGYQFAWDFTHPATGIREANVLTLELGQEYTMAITSRDVVHAFWVPEFRLKQDATPGYIRRLTLTPTMLHDDPSFGGRYADGFPLRCAELCGSGHSQMIANVRVLSPEAYAAWEAEAIAALSETPDGATVYQNNGCIGCHVLDAIGATGAVGPSHNDMGDVAEQRVAEGAAASAEEYLEQSLRDPNAYVVSGYPPGVMPAYTPEQISEEEMDALIQFLMEQVE